MQPAWAPRSNRSAAVRRSSARMSEMPSRPPGRSTRKLSAKTAGRSVDRLITQLEMITSTEPSGSGIASIWPSRNSTFCAPAAMALARARSSIWVVMSRPYALPAGPTRRADSSTSMPPPEPRSSTVSPGRRSATATGLPQPRLARTAASGKSPVSGYPGVPQQPSSREASGLPSVIGWPACAARARSAYRAATAARIWSRSARAMVILRVGRARACPSPDQRRWGSRSRRRR